MLLIGCDSTFPMSTKVLLGLESSSLLPVFTFFPCTRTTSIYSLSLRTQIWRMDSQLLKMVSQTDTLNRRFVYGSVLNMLPHWTTEKLIDDRHVLDQASEGQFSLDIFPLVPYFWGQLIYWDKLRSVLLTSDVLNIWAFPRTSTDPSKNITF